MKKSLIAAGLIVCVIIFTLNFISAHNPRIVYDKANSINNPLVIENPEISQAFYGQLSGYPDYYLIESDMEFNFYVSILIPYLKTMENPSTSFNVQVYSFVKNDTIISLYGGDSEWKEMYEPFTGDNYLEGPNAGSDNLPAGKYLITVSNNINKGTYVLVVGQKESWTPKEIFNTIQLLPRLKKEFFWKPSYTAYFNLFGLFMLIFLIVVIAIIYLVVRTVRKGKKKRKR